MANEPTEAAVSQFAGDTQMGPVHPVEATDLYGAGEHASADVRYALSPRERDAWQFAVDQAGTAMGQMSGPDPHTAAAGPFDGPYDAGTIQPGVPLYGMAGG